jgi:uncharacterized protein YggT (Ycf19 family)
VEQHLHTHDPEIVREREVVVAPVVTPPTHARLVQLVYLVFGVVESLIGLRVLLKLLAANPDAGFARFIYDVTAPLVALFRGIFTTPQSDGSVLELSSLLAIAIYALVAYLIVRIIEIMARRQTLLDR